MLVIGEKVEFVIVCGGDFECVGNGGLVLTRYGRGA